MASIHLDRVVLDYPVITGTRSIRRDLFSLATGGTIKSSGRQTIVRGLNNITLDLHDGDRLALIGHNGAGKSTLLRVLAGIYAPTHGTIQTTGRLSTLFTTSPGLDVDDTGFETIRTCGMFLGMSRKEITEKTDEIAEFTGLGEFLTLPVRTYSAGMVTRLSFAIATAIDPEILIIDEGLAAGDANFAHKASSRLESMINRSSILVFASHSIDLLKNFCNKAILMSHGAVLQEGDLETIAGAYQDLCG